MLKYANIIRHNLTFNNNQKNLTVNIVKKNQRGQKIEIPRHYFTNFLNCQSKFVSNLLLKTLTSDPSPVAKVRFLQSPKNLRECYEDYREKLSPIFG